MLRDVRRTRKRFRWDDLLLVLPLVVLVTAIVLVFLSLMQTNP